MPAPARELTKPQTGTYSARFVRGGPEVPIKVTIVPNDDKEDGWVLQAVVDGRPMNRTYTEAEVEAECMIWVTHARSRDERDPDARLLMQVLLASGISQERYDRLIRLRATAPEWHPCHKPYEPVSLGKLPPLGRKM